MDENLRTEHCETLHRARPAPQLPDYLFSAISEVLPIARLPILLWVLVLILPHLVSPHTGETYVFLSNPKHLCKHLPVSLNCPHGLDPNHALNQYL